MFGFINDDKSVPIGKRSRHSGYEAAYTKIENEFRSVYDALQPIQDQWMRDHAVTTYEYLLLDNYELGDSHFFVERLTAKPEMNPWDVIGLMAEAFMKRWVEEERLAGVKARMGFEIRMFPYAATRCRKFYAIKPWHLQKNAEIKQYRRMWVSALEDRFARLKVEMS